MARGRKKEWTDEDVSHALRWVERKAKTAKVFRDQAGKVDDVLESIRSAPTADVPNRLREALTNQAWQRLLTALRVAKHQRRQAAGSSPESDEAASAAPEPAIKEEERARYDVGTSTRGGRVKLTLGDSLEVWIAPEQAAAIRDYIQKGKPLPGSGQGESPASAIPPEQAPKQPEPLSGADLQSRIRSACVSLTGGKPQRIRLADLRAELSDVPRAQLDEALLAMEREGALVLYPLDNPKEMGPADKAANLSNSAGFPRHVCYLLT